MLSEDDYFDDSGDPELAFARIEGKLRSRTNELLQAAEQNGGGVFQAQLDYITHVLAAADYYEIKALDRFQIPTYSSRTEDIWELYKDVVQTVDYFSVKIKIASANGRRAYSVVLDPAEKEKIRHLAEQIKKAIESSNLATAKRESLLDKLNLFLAEVDKDRTKIQIVSDLMYESAVALGDAAEGAEPAVRLLERVMAFFGLKIQDQAKRLPPPRKPRQLEPPPRRLPPPAANKGRQTDDDIPF
jgi:hypothetical protein